MDNRKTHEFYQNQHKSKKPTKLKKKPIKVAYISSPVMVQANNAFEFRTIVEDIMGQNSNVARFEDASMAYGTDASLMCLIPKFQLQKMFHQMVTMQPLEFNESSFLR